MLYIREFFIPLQRLALISALMLAAVCSIAEEVASAEPSHALFSTAEVKPWGYIDEAGQLRGATVDFVNRLSELAGVPVANHIRPYPRTILEVEKGEVDLALMFAGFASDRIGIDLGKVTDMEILVTGLPHQPLINSLDDLKGKSVGYIRGALYGPAFDVIQSVEKMPLKDMTQGLQMLMLGRIEAMVGTNQALYYTLQEMKIPPDQIKPLMVLERTSGRLYFSRASDKTHWIEPFQKALQTMQENGDLERIFALPGRPQSSP